MLSPWYSYIAAMKVLFFFILVFYYLPSRFVGFKKDDEALDRFFISFIHMVAVTIVLVHVLVFLRLYDYISTLGGYAVVLALIARQRGYAAGEAARAISMRFMVVLLDAVESPGGLGAAMRDYLRSRRRLFGSLSLTWLRWAVNPLQGLLPLGVLGYSAWLRFNHSLTRPYLGASDAYVHLAWTKYLSAGDIYKDGIYPYGYHAIISALERLTFMDPLLILRFVGPLGGLLMVLSVYYVARRYCSGLEVPAVLGAFVFGSGQGLPSIIWRQISPLPQEFAAIFFLPGVYFATRYAETRERRDLALFAECLGITVLIHPYASVYIVIAVAAVVALKALSGRDVLQTGASLALWGSVASVVGALPQAIGWAIGKKFHSLGYVLSSVTAAAPSQGDLPLWGRILTGNMFIDVSMAVSVLLLAHILGTLVLGKARPPEAVSQAILPLLSLVMNLLYRPAQFGLPSLMDPNRTGIFFSLVASVIYGIFVHRVFRLLGPRLLAVPSRAYVATGLTALAVFGLGFKYPSRPPTGVRLEYSAAVNNYLVIRGSFPALDWTIVSPVEQYSEVLNKGWHYESWEFVRDFTMEDARNPRFDLAIPTTYIFIYAEKVLLPTGQPVDLKLAGESLPPPGKNPDGQYYKNVENRSIIQAKLLVWSREYMKSHSNMSVFYEDSEMVVYMVKHVPKIKSSSATKGG